MLLKSKITNFAGQLSEALHKWLNIPLFGHNKGRSVPVPIVITPQPGTRQDPRVDLRAGRRSR